VKPKGAAQTTFEVVPGRSAVLVKARSNVGPISFATSELRGEISAEVDGHSIDTTAPVKAQLIVSLRSLTSGNTLYDTELKRRIDARRYPDAVVELSHASHLAGSDRYELSGRIEIHDVVRVLDGSVTVESLAKGALVVRGQQAIDIREFDLAVPTTLALKIYPEVSIELHLEARAR
jgi:polyisoprenoid-binding protein YceI